MEARFGRFAGAKVGLPPLGTPAPRSAWGLEQAWGRIVELSGWRASARLTAAFGLVLEAQQQHEPAAWVGLRGSSFFPPDAAAGGVDLASLTVVRMATARDAARAADQLVRSGGFGLVVIDLATAAPRDVVPPPLLNRLLGLAQKHEAAVVVLTEKPPSAPSLSSLVSLRVEARRGVRPAQIEDAWQVEVEVLKDKRRGPGAKQAETCRGPAGLR
jgi:recombination protein RecA